MQVETWPIERVHPYPNNPRRNKAAVERVKDSLLAFGWRQPLVVTDGGVIIAGHTRYQAALALGWTDVPVVVAAGLNEGEARAYRIADNKIPEASTWDFQKLAAELVDLKAEGAHTSAGMPLWELQTLLTAEPYHGSLSVQSSAGVHRVFATVEQAKVIEQAVAQVLAAGLAADAAGALVVICSEYADEVEQ